MLQCYNIQRLELASILSSEHDQSGVSVALHYQPRIQVQQITVLFKLICP